MNLLRSSAALGAALVLALPSTLPAVDAATVALLMPNPTAVVGLNVESGKSSPFGKFILSRIRNEEQEFEKFIQATGFDPRRDLREVIFASTAGVKDHNGLVIARGAFNPVKILAAARAEGKQVTSHQGVDVIVMDQAVSSKAAGWVALMDGQTVVAGEQPQVRDAIDRAKSGARPDPQLLARINELASRNDAWMFSNNPGRSLTGNMPNRELNGIVNGDLFQSVTQASGGIKFGANVVITGEAVTRSDRDAQALSDVLRFLTGMIQSNRNGPEADRVATWLDSLQTETKDNRFRFTLSVPQVEIEKLFTGGRATVTI